MSTELQLSPLVAQWVVQALTRLMATFAIIQGVFICLGGPQRWQSPGLAVAMLVPGAPATWGVILAALGAVAMAGTFTARLRMTGYAMLGIGTWCLFFAVSIMVVVIRNNAVATTGVWTYLALAITSCTLGVGYMHSLPHQVRLREVTSAR